MVVLRHRTARDRDPKQDFGKGSCEAQEKQHASDADWCGGGSWWATACPWNNLGPTQISLYMRGGACAPSAPPSGSASAALARLALLGPPASCSSRRTRPRRTCGIRTPSSLSAGPRFLSGNAVQVPAVTVHMNVCTWLTARDPRAAHIAAEVPRHAELAQAVPANLRPQPNSLGMVRRRPPPTRRLRSRVGLGFQ